MEKLNAIVSELFKDEKASDYIGLLNDLLLVYIQQKEIDKENKCEAVCRVGNLQKKIVELHEARQ